MKKEFPCLGIFFAAILLIFPAYSVSASDSNEILLKSRHFTPQRGITSSAKAAIEAVPGRVHVFLQLDRKPTPEDVNQLENEGVKLFSYIPNKAWLASIPSDKSDEIASLSSVRSINDILPEDKISPHITAGEIFEPSVKDGKTSFIIEFFEDVPAIEIEETITRHNGVIEGWVPILNAVEAVLPVEEGVTLCSEEGVKWLEQELPLGPTNNGTRAAVGVNAVQAPPYNLNGTGVSVLVYDVALVDSTHSDLVNRVIIGETGYLDYYDDHPTHVAGTVAGDGTLSGGKYRGMAPAANIISYHYDCGGQGICLYSDPASIADMDANFTIGIHDDGADIITASIVCQPALWGMSCSNEGDYSAYAQEIDSYAMLIPITWAAANERGYEECGTDYNTISPTATAKNAIVVGAINSNDNSMTSFSSWGPTDDGRIKPDIVAPGCENAPYGLGDPCDPNKSIWSTKWSSYGGMCGTSMATPAVAGSIALMLQQWRMIHPGQYDPPPSAIKAILLNTAVDLGNPGPDYSFGYGRLNVKAAIDLIRENTIIYGAIEHKEFTIEVPQGMPELKVTLAWDDQAGEPLANPALVWDMDLIVKDPNGTPYYPWILDPANPSAPATRGEDHTNNVEQVSVACPVAGTWTVEVNIDISQMSTCAVVWGFPRFFDISKEDNVPDGNSVLPGDSITYTIRYSYPLEQNINDCVITDFLPPDLIFISASGPNIAYHPNTRTVTWNLGTLEPNEQGYVTLTAKVSDCITGCGAVINTCKIEGSDCYWTRWASENTPVLCASSPSPTCGELSDFLCTGDPNLNLTWCPGRLAADVNGHEVYFGTNYDDVHDAVNSWPIGEVYKGPVTNPIFPIEANKIELGTTYYWRIDEINDSNVWKGSIWSFTTDCYLIDNFNSYVDGTALAHVWKDYRYQSGYNPVTCSQINVASDPNRGGPKYQSMLYQFLNKTWSPYYSEVNATIGTGTYDLNVATNWLELGAEVLSLWFDGNSTNDANHPMYVTLVDSDTPVHIAKVKYNGDMNDIRDPNWHHWTIPLEDFTGVNLTKVKNIVIGFGDKTKAATDGTVYFENIGLYLNKRCFPGCWPVSDFDSDCVVDFYDFAILAQSWLTDPNQSNYNPVCNIAVPHDNIIDYKDLARFCEDWLWHEVGKMPMGAGYSELLYLPPSGGERVESTGGELAEGVELQSAPQPQMQPESATEPPQPEPQHEPVHTTQELIDWLQGLLEDEQIKNTPTEDNVRRMIESLKEEL